MLFRSDSEHMGRRGSQLQPRGLEPSGIQLAGPCLLQTDIDLVSLRTSALPGPQARAHGSRALAAKKEGERETELCSPFAMRSQECLREIDFCFWKRLSS